MAMPKRLWKDRQKEIIIFEIKVGEEPNDISPELLEQKSDKTSLLSQKSTVVDLWRAQT